METLTMTSIDLEKELNVQKVADKKQSVSVIILLVNNKNFVGVDKPYEIDLLGKSMLDWVKLACQDYKTTLVPYDNSSDVLQTIKPHLDDSEYTFVVYSDTPLLKSTTVKDVIDYALLKQTSVCKLTRGYVFNTDFVKNADKIYTAEPRYFDEEDFMTAFNNKQLMLIEDILKNRIISFHLNNGVRIMDATTTTIYADVTIEQGVVIYPNNHLYGVCYIGNNVKLLPNNYIENSIIDDDCTIMYSVIKNSKVPAGTKLGPFEKIIQ